MGHNLHVNSTLELSNPSKEVQEKLYQCEDTTERRYFWFIDEHIMNQEKSILFQLEKLLNIPFTWLGNVKHGDEISDDFEAGKMEDNYVNIDLALERLKKIQQRLEEGIVLEGLLVFASDMSQVNRAYYPKYVQEGEFLADIKKLSELLACYKKAGDENFYMFWT